MVPAPTVAIVAYNPVQTRSSTFRTPCDHKTTWSRICTPYVRATTSTTKAPERLVYVAWRFQTHCWLVVPVPTVDIVVYNLLQTHSSSITTTGDHHTEPRAGICTPYERATTSQRRYQRCSVRGMAVSKRAAGRWYRLLR